MNSLYLLFRCESYLLVNFLFCRANILFKQPKITLEIFPQRLDKSLYAYSKDLVLVLGLGSVKNAHRTFLLYDFQRFGTKFDEKSVEIGKRGLQPYRFLE